jgi:tetratricopeptide (TPR) repeat protein
MADRCSVTISLYLTFAMVVGAAGVIVAQNEIVYDPEKGIMFVDKKDTTKRGGAAKSLVSFDKTPDKQNESKVNFPPQVPVHTRDSTDLHVGRKKDPPALYFTSGLEYFKNADFAHALQNFQYADSVDPKPLYRLWVGKTYRQLGEPRKTLSIMETIVKNHPECDVADDAQFEIAVYYENRGDYDSATTQYALLSERYPFGESYSTGEKFIDIARDRRTSMRAEMNNMLAILGYTSEDIAANFTAFQKDNGLKETGIADLSTVQAIKKTGKKMLDREQLREQNELLAKRYLTWAEVAGAVGLMSIVLSLNLFFRLRARAREIIEFKENLADINLKKL